MAWKTLFLNEAVAVDEESDRFPVGGLEDVHFLMTTATLNGGVFEVIYVVEVGGAEVDLNGWHIDPTGSSWRKWIIDQAFSLMGPVPVMGAGWMKVKLTGGTGATGVSLAVRCKEETS